MKYTKEILSIAVQEAMSFTDVARTLNVKPIGSTITHLRKRCAVLGVDTSHFTSQAHGKGATFKLKPVEEILVLGTSEQGRLEAKHLRRALIEVGPLS